MLYKIIVIVGSLIFSVCSAFSQSSNEYHITIQLSGLKNGISVYFFNVKGERAAGVFKNGEYIFSGIDSLPGTPVDIQIDTFPAKLRVIVDRESAIKITGELVKWPNVLVSGSKVHEEYNDFQNNIQAPFSCEYKRYEMLMKRITGKSDVFEWERHSKILVGRDSLDVFLATQIYQKAVVTYQKETLEWIILHPTSLYTPELIMQWWPRPAWKSSYQNLSSPARNSYYGVLLKEQIGREI